VSRHDDDQEAAKLLARAAMERLRRLPKMSDGPRDARKGDRWLPWHFKPKTDEPEKDPL
jgi:hypothetical protein